MKVLNKEYPNFNTVGETWVTEPAYTAAWQKDSKLSDINSNLKTVMDFAFFDRLSQAKNEETDDWWKGWNRIYNSLCYDYLYTDPSSVMAFIENHDTDRFLGNGKDSTALKQAYALLLTMKRIPQLYYGTEILMNGTKAETDAMYDKTSLVVFLVIKSISSHQKVVRKPRMPCLIGPVVSSIGDRTTM